MEGYTSAWLAYVPFPDAWQDIAAEPDLPEEMDSGQFSVYGKFHRYTDGWQHQ